LEESGIFDVDYFSQVSKNAFIEQKTEKADSTDTRAAPSERPEPDSIARMHAILRNIPQLCTYKAIVFGSTPASMISPSEAANIGNWLSRRGGGLIFTGGNSFAGSVATTGSSLSALMPATVAAGGRTAESVGRESPVEAAKAANHFTLEINANGLSTPLGEFEWKNTDGKLNIALNGDGFVFGNLKAGTIVIADLVSEKARVSRRYGIVAMPFGEGRVIAVGPSDSWKIKTAEPTVDPDSGAGPFETLWHGIVLYAVQNAGEQSELALSESTPTAGSRLLIRLRSREEDFSSSEINGVSAFAQELDANSQNSALPVQLSFLPVPDSTSVWQSEVTFKSPGTYAVTANFDRGGRSDSITRTVTVSDPRRFPSGSASEAFSRLAHERGGRLYHPDEITSLAESLLKLPHSIKAEYETWQLRRLWPMAFILPLLASLGWFLQRRYAELV
jgi:hypothetical protein